MAIKRERLRALRAKRAANSVQRERRARSDRLENSHAGGNALPLGIWEIMASLGRPQHRMWGLGPWLADLPRDFSNRGPLLTDEIRCPGYNGAKPFKPGLWVIEGSMTAPRWC
jgi:hypothetical protein